jgi:hypothetical protein
MRVMLLATAALLFLASPALADGPVATAGGSGPAAPLPTTAPPPLPTAVTEAPEGPQIAMGPCGPETVKPDGKLETKPHGEVEAGVGTSGYRHVAGIVCQPIGQNGAVTVGVSDTHIDDTYRRRDRR